MSAPLSPAQAERIALAAADLLHALDRGDFGDLRIGPSFDRVESAYVTGLRDALAGPWAGTDFDERYGEE